MFFRVCSNTSRPRRGMSSPCRFEKKNNGGDSSPPEIMDALLNSDSSLAWLRYFCSRLDFKERKALLLLSRFQNLPDPDTSHIIFHKTQHLTNKLVFHPPYNGIFDLNLDGEQLLSLITQPIFAGLVISFALGVELSPDQVASGVDESFRKEFKATQTIRKPSTWDWDAILSGDSRPTVVHIGQPRLSPLQMKFSRSLRSFRSSYNGRIVLPHYSRRGISSITAGLFERRFRVHKDVYYSKNSLYKAIDLSNVTSLDIVRHYIRTGIWIRGDTEMKQKWYPNGLLPRTYFSWGGMSISASAYLRGFFNELVDQFAPTQRHNRVQPDWLCRSENNLGTQFAFYDLTSFTSWFHEHVPFLHSLARYFTGTSVDHVGPFLSLATYDVGDLIRCYIRHCNDFPRFQVAKGLMKEASEILNLSHQCAGFLGIPGNLATCTLPHGLAMASRFENEHQLQVPGDDVGFEYDGEDDMHDSLKVALSLGSLQMDKVFNLPDGSIYLKRLVIDEGVSIQLADMLIYPLLPFLISPQGEYTQQHYGPLNRDQLSRRTSGVVVSFLRQLWGIKQGNLSFQAQSTILTFLRYIHLRTRLPQGAIFQGELCDGSEPEISLSGIQLKFPVDEDDCLLYDPDLSFASRHVEIMRIRLTSEVLLTEDIRDLDVGRRIFVPQKKGWRFLEDMGYVRIHGIPGPVVTLIGVEAKDAFLTAKEPNLREIEVLLPLKVENMVAVGILPPNFALGEVHAGFGFVDRDLKTEQLWRYSSRYVDLDLRPRYYDSLPFRNDGLSRFAKEDSVVNEDELDY